MSRAVPAALRERVRQRAGGRCEYCLVPEAVALVKHEVDHIVAMKHGGLTDDDNLAQSCRLCNRRKGSDIAARDPESGTTVQLFHPRHDRWTDHFAFDGPRLVGRTATGRATIEFLQLNRPDRLDERKWLMTAELLPPGDPPALC